MMKQCKNFELSSKWLGLGYTVYVDMGGDPVVYNHDKNYKIWTQTVRRNDNTEDYKPTKFVPQWAVTMKRK